MASDRIPHAFPQFTNVEDERRHRKQRLAAAFRLFGQFGFDEGIAGHITARDPEHLDHFWVNPLGMNFKQIRVKDLILVNHKGDVVEGTWPVNRAAFVIHSRGARGTPRGGVRRPRPLRVRQGAGRRCASRSIPSRRTRAAFYGDHALFDDYTGAVLELEEGKRLAHALGGHKAVILANHGLLTVGQTVDEAAWWFITMERTCQAQLLAEAAGRPVPIDPEQAAKTAGQVGHRNAGWRAFQPLYDWIVEQQPDLLED